MNKTKTARLYKTDIDFMKSHFNKSIAEVVSSLLWGKKDEFKEVVKVLLTDELQTIAPYFKKRLDSIEQMIQSGEATLIPTKEKDNG